MAAQSRPSSTEATETSEPSESSALPAPGDHNLKSCSGTKKLCGIQGDNVCCDSETECCVRKPHRTVCVRKKEKC